MKTRNKYIGSFEAKTRLSSLLNDVQEGQEYVITKRGKPVARLVPCGADETGPDIAETMAQFEAIRKSVRGRVNIKEFIIEGRKR